MCSSTFPPTLGETQPRMLVPVSTMRATFCRMILFLGLMGMGSVSWGQISITAVPYNPAVTTFNTYNPGSAGTLTSTIPAGWTASSQMTPVYNGQGDGTVAAGGYWAYGLAGEFSLGAQRSGTPMNITYTVSFTNNSGCPISDITFNWNYEQWRYSNTSGWDVSGTGALTGNVTLNGADFAGVAAGTNGVVTSTPATVTLTGLSIPNGASFGISWVTTNVSLTDNGVAIDNFGVSANTNAPVGTPTAITVSGGSEPSCQLTNGTTTTTYSTTATNSTGFNWSLSTPAAGSIDASTGVMTWANGFAGTVDIQVTANGCNGPSAQTARTVSITPTVGTPTFVSGTNTARCQGADMVIYPATATNSTGITYSLDATSLGAGNSIDAATGEVTYVAGWNGISTITATATGCNGPKTANHTAITVGTPVFNLGPTSSRCQGAGTVTYTATSANSAGISYSLDATSLGAGNTIDMNTGAVSYVFGWSGTTMITATALGCSGPATADHTVTVNPLPSGLAIDATENSGLANDDDIICAGANVLFTVTPNTFVGYNFRINGVSVQNSAANTFNSTSLNDDDDVIVTVSSAAGCSNTIGTVTISVFPLPTPSFTAAPGANVCSGTPVTYTTQAGQSNYVWTVPGTAGVDYTISSGGTSLDNSMTLQWLTGGSKMVTVNYSDANGCSGAAPASSTTTVTVLPSASISYTGDPYCSNETTAPVTLTGNGSGTYSSTAGLSINSPTGEVDITTSTAATYTVTYTIPAADGCPAVMTTASLTITTLPTASISYAGDPYCSNEGTAMITQTGATGGAYSATPAGLMINGVTGAVGLAASTPGTYTVTYTIAAAGGCPAVTPTTTITVNALPRLETTINNVTVTSNNDGTDDLGTFSICDGNNVVTNVFSDLNAVPGNLQVYQQVALTNVNFPFCNNCSAPLSIFVPATGTAQATLVNAAMSGTIVLRYRAWVDVDNDGVIDAGECAGDWIQYTVTVTPQPVATISYAADPYCANEGTASVTQTGTTGGTYSSTAGLTINGTTGTVDITTSTAGTYTVTYTIAAGGGCPAATFQTSITINALPAVTASGGSFNRNQTVTLMATSATATAYAWSGPNAFTANVANPTIAPPHTPGTYVYTVTVTDANGCMNTATATVIIYPAILYVNDNSLAGDINGGTTGNDNNPGTAALPLRTIQKAVNVALAGDVIHVDAGTYNEDVNVSKQLTILGAGIDVSIVSGPIGGDGATFRIGTSGIVIDGFTITRDGNNTTDWNNPGLNNTGLAVQGQTSSVEVRNSKFDGNRTGIDVNNSNGNNIHNNIISNNRTGLLFRNQTDNTMVIENVISNNWTAGILFLDGSGGSNSPVQTAANSMFNNNNLSGNWYGEIVDRQTGGSLPAPGTNLKNVECNWYGTTSPVVSTANSTEPGYAAQIPVAYGGTATPPGGQPDILGPASANLDYISWLVSGTDIQPATSGFQPAPGACAGAPVVIASAVPANETCGTPGSITVTFSGGTPAYNIAWTGGSTPGITSPYTITGLAAGIYGITVTDMNGSTATATATILYLPVKNLTGPTYYATIQAAVNAAATNDVLEVCSGPYNEQVLVNKSVKIKGVGPTKPIVNFTGTVTGKPALFDVSQPNVTLENLDMRVDLVKLSSAIIASATDLDNLTIKNNEIKGIGSSAAGNFGAYGNRNAVSINYGGNISYRIAAGGVDNVLFQGNTVIGALSTDLSSGGINRFFRAGVCADEAGGIFTGNTLQSINHDIQVRFGSNGNIDVTSNNLNGGGVELVEHNAGAGAMTVSNNIFDATSAAPGTAVLRLKNNQSLKTTLVSGNTFSNHEWAVSLENYNTVTLDNNTFTPKATSTTYHHVVVNTKSISSNSATIVQTTIGATLTNNTFNGSSTTGGTALSFHNHDSDAASFGTFTIGTAGNENNFNAGIGTFVRLDNQTGSSGGSTFPDYTNLIGGGAGALTTMVCWTPNINIQSNQFNVGTGLKLPSTMNSAERTTLETNLFHKPDAACLGNLIYFLPVHNLTQNTFYSTIQSAVNAAVAGNVIECAEWTFNEKVTIDKTLTLQGVSEANCIINGTGLGTGSGITVNSGVTNVWIKYFTVQNHAGTGPGGSAGIYAALSNSGLKVEHCTIKNNVGGSGFYANGPVNGLILNDLDVSGHTGGARGIVVWNGFKENISITNCDVYNNNCCGIELQDGTASGVTMTGNNVHDNFDNGMSAVGLTGSTGPNVISTNTVTNNGRFGIEIKNPDGNGTNITVSNNIVTLTGSFVAARPSEKRDLAGIAAFRRAVLAGNVDVPTGVRITGNTVSGYIQDNGASSSEGFGIVVEGIGHTVTGNTVTGNDVGIQQQAGHTPYPGDGNQNDLADQYFGRGNSPMTCGNTISGNTLSGNGANTRNVGPVGGPGVVTNTNTGESFCSIQSAIDDPQTLNTHGISVGAGTYVENVVINKEVTITGAGQATTIVMPAISNPNCGGAGGGSLCAGGSNVMLVQANNVTIQQLTINGDNPALTGLLVGGADIDARNGIITNHNAGIFNNLTVNQVTVKNIFLRGVYASSGGTFSFTGNTVDNVQGNTSSIALFNFGGAGAFTNNMVSNANDGIASNNSTGTTYTGNAVTASGSGIHTDNNGSGGGTADIIQNNTVTNSTVGGYGIFVFAPYLNVQVKENTVTNVDVGLANAGQYATATTSFVQNTVNGMNKVNSTGVYQTTNLFGFGTADVSGVFTNNFIQNNTDGFYLEYEPGRTNTIIVNGNSITGNTNGVTLNNLGGTLTNNFECNWWGVASASAVATAVGAPVDYTPWRTDGTDSAPATAGFQPTGGCSATPVVIDAVAADNIICGETTGSLLVTFSGGNSPFNIAWTGGSATNVTSPYNITGLAAGPYGVTVTDANSSMAVSSGTVQSLPVTNLTGPTYYATIQAAINAASPNDVIEVCKGTYVENITVNKSLTLNGPNAAVDPCSNAVRVAEAILMPATSGPEYGAGESVMMEVQANNVTIAGFTFDGDNPALTSAKNANGANIDAVDGIGVYTVVSGLTIARNILKNINEGAIDQYYTVPTPTSGNTINRNKIDNVPGTVYGQGVTLAENFYAQVENNCMTRVRIGVQTGNGHLANPGAAATISNNQIESSILGIWHNLQYGSASNYTIAGNTLTTVTGALTNEGIFISSLNGTVNATVSNNTVTGAKWGVELWSNQTATPVTVTGGTLTNCETGVFANNYDGYASDALPSAYVVAGVNIVGGTTGVYVKDNMLNTNSATVSVQVQGNSLINGAPTGLLIEGGDASASFSGATPATFTGQTTYINQISNGTNVPATNIDATAVTFGGQTGATASLAQNFAIEDKIVHKIDDPALGFVLVKANHDFVTVNSFVAPATTTPSIQRGVNAASTGFTVNVNSGTYNEQVLVNKSLTLLGATPKPVINFTGTVSGRPTLFDVTRPGVTIENFQFAPDLSKVGSAIIASDAVNGVSNLTIKNNSINPYRTGALVGFGTRNAVNINYGAYRVNSSNPGNILAQGNTIAYNDNGTAGNTADDAGFRAGFATDEGGGTFTLNTIQSISQDIEARFGGAGNINITSNNINGGGVNLAEYNSGAGTINVTGNTFDGTVGNTYTSSLRLKNNTSAKTTVVSGNMFTGHNWGISLENYQAVTISSNVFTPAPGSTTFRHITVNTKEISSSSATVLQIPISAVITGNTFNSSTPTVGGIALAFYNHDSDNDAYGTFPVGTAGSPNEFAKNFTHAIYLGDQTGASAGAPGFPEYTGVPSTTMACWDVDINIEQNKFDVGAPLPQYPVNMTAAQLATLEAQLYHQPDNACLGELLYFRPVIVNAKVHLQGPYNATTNLMRDDLRQISSGPLFPTTEPFSQYNTAPFNFAFTHVNGGGGEMITNPAVLTMTGPNAIVDWVFLELRNKLDRTQVLATRSALLQRDGDIVDVDGVSPVMFRNSFENQYYLMVRHRNHLGAMTNATVDFTNAGNYTDFSDPALVTYGTVAPTATSARKLLEPGVYGLLAGNVNLKTNGTSFQVKYTGGKSDPGDILIRVGDTTPLNVVSGYYLEDVNLNGKVKYTGSNDDTSIILNNVGSTTPLNVITQQPPN